MDDGGGSLSAARERGEDALAGPAHIRTETAIKLGGEAAPGGAKGGEHGLTRWVIDSQPTVKRMLCEEILA